MNKAKLVFFQTTMISTAIFALNGLSEVILHFKNGVDSFNYGWYYSLSIICIGFLCSLPTFFLEYDIKTSKLGVLLRVFLHFITIGLIVSLGGFVFKWYENLSNYLMVMISYVIIYLLVWIISSWMTKTNENKINAAIKNIQDEE